MPPNDPSAYIAQDRRYALQQGAALPDRAAGAVIFADVTGFTPLAEALVQTLGPRRGAEELTALLNQVYSTLIAQVERFGGSVITFSGDAMTCWFSRNDERGMMNDEESDRDSSFIVHASSFRAVACALAMRQAMSAFSAIPTTGGPVALRVKVALASGSVRRFELGDPQIQLLDVLAGRALDRLASSAQLAERDDVIVDAQTLAEVAPIVAIDGWRADAKAGTRAAAIADLTQAIEPAPWPALPDRALADERVRPWLLPAVYERLRGSADPFLAELRPAVALMLQFAGFDYDRDDVGPQLDTYIRSVQAIVTRYAGVLVDITMADKGGYLYAAFGAPVAHEDDPTRALRAALELRDLRIEPDISVRIGLSQGTMRTGPYGGATRRAYGVLGDEVNLACRLMSAAAPGQILVSGRLHKALSGGFFWSALPALQVRGKHAPVEVYRLLGEATPAPAGLRADAAPADMVGRAAERAALAEAVEALLVGRGGVIVVEGEPGIGKSRLIAELGERLHERGLAMLAGAGRSIEQQSAYRAWRDLFTAYFELDDASEPAERQGRVQGHIQASAPGLAERLPLLNDVLAFGLPETPLTSGLSGRMRSEKLGGLLVDLLRARAVRQPTALVLEDAHWLDSLSWGLASRVAQTIVAEQLPILLVVATRPLEAGHLGMPQLRELLGTSGVRWMRLEQLPEADTVALAAERLGLLPAELPPALAALLRERAGGNPFFAEELIATLRERGMIRIEADPDNVLARPRCVVAGDLREIDRLLPETLQGLLLARIDRLPPEQQITLKVAAVVGPTFAFAPLQFARGRQATIGEAQLKAQLRALSAQDYTWLEEPEPNLAYRFKHVLTQEAAYETLLYAQRRTLHRTVAEWYEHTFQDKEIRRQADRAIEAVQGQSSSGLPVSLSPYYPLLAHHYRRAESPERERHYAWLAGIQAAEQYANAEALAFFTRTLELTPADDLAGRYAALFEREAIEELLALRDEQARDLAELEALADALGDDSKRAEIARSRARFAERVGDIATMHVLARRAVTLAEAAGATQVAIDAYDQLAWASMRAGNYAEAIEFAHAGLRLARTSDNRRNEGQMLTALGCAYAESEEFAMARTYLEQSRSLFHELGRHRGESVALGNLGEVVARQGDYVTARGYYEQALHLYRTTGDRRNEGWMLDNLGQAAMQLGDYAAAREYCEQARTIARAIGDRNTESLALIDLGQIAHQLGEHAAGLELGTAGLHLAMATYTRVHGLLAVGHALATLGRAAEAAASYAEARDLAQATDLRARAAEATAGLARMALANGDLAEAVAWIEPLAARLEHDPLAGAVEPLRVFHTCYEVLNAAGDPRAAAVLAAGRALLHARANQIAGESLRRSFLEQVPHHRALLAAGSVVSGALHPRPPD